MPKPVKWTLRAIQEAESWIDYLCDHNRVVANQASVDLVRRTDRLGQFNDLGRMGRVTGTRELSLSKWHKIVVYTIT